jgi:hypothetical protein
MKQYIFLENHNTLDDVKKLFNLKNIEFNDHQMDLQLFCMYNFKIINKEWMYAPFDCNDEDYISLDEAIKSSIQDNKRSFQNYKLNKVNKMYGNHKLYYLKWDITSDLSLRYFIQFQDRKELEGEFVIKSHSEKKYILLDSKEKINFIFKEFIKDKDNYKTIIGKFKKKKYSKIIAQNGKIDYITE